MLTTGDKLKTNIGSSICNKTTVRWLGMIINDKLSFKRQFNKACKEAIHKLYLLCRFSNYLSQRKLKIIIKAFITPQFRYFPLVYMWRCRKLNSKINNLHERALRLVYKDR